jgi:hypothetical protein
VRGGRGAGEGSAEAHGGDLGFTLPCAKFVTSLDGVVAPGPEYPFSGSAISGGDDADRFVLGQLRACSDAVLIGAGTLRSTPAEMISARRRRSHLFLRYRLRFLVVIDVFQCRQAQAGSGSSPVPALWTAPRNGALAASAGFAQPRGWSGGVRALIRRAAGAARSLECLERLAGGVVVGAGAEGGVDDPDGPGPPRSPPASPGSTPWHPANPAPRPDDQEGTVEPRPPDATAGPPGTAAR